MEDDIEIKGRFKDKNLSHNPVALLYFFMWGHVKCAYIYLTVFIFKLFFKDNCISWLFCCRFNNGQECGVKYCKELSYREHFHCMDCNFRVFIKKEEMVRHYKWHRKREESLQHGFMRYSPMDDCSQKFNNCTHNGRQTHYHCLQV